MGNGLAIDLDGAPRDRRDAPVKGDEAAPARQDRANGHRRALSNTVLGKLNLLRGADEQAKNHEDDRGTAKPVSAMAWTQKESKTRRRTSSLRKTAILGTGRAKPDARERRNSLKHRKLSNATAISADLDLSVLAESVPEGLVVASEDSTPPSWRPLDYDGAPASADAQEIVPAPPVSPYASPAQLLTLSNAAPAPRAPVASAVTLTGPLSPLKSPTTSQSPASTTDEDDTGLTFSRPTHILPSTTGLNGAGAAPSSYFVSPDTLLRRKRSSTMQKPLSPLSALPMDAYASQDEVEHTYSETEWWGWVMLVVTWLVFVVGMGSCLGVWSWAWDVGQTPYAPPELEDDPTLPIVGYYPALIILTAVMAWVWVVVAWVGMKYFKHAKIQGDEG